MFERNEKGPSHPFRISQKILYGKIPHCSGKERNLTSATTVP